MNHCLLVACYLNIWMGLAWASSFAAHSAFHQNDTKPKVFEHFLFLMLETQQEQVHDFCLVQLDYVRHTPSINTGNCHEFCKTWGIFACFGSWIGTHHGQHHIIILECGQQQLQISWILYTPTPWQLNARLLGASWDQMGLVGTSWE